MQKNNSDLCGIIVLIRWTGLAPGEFEFPFPGSLTSTFLKQATSLFSFRFQVGSIARRSAMQKNNSDLNVAFTL